MNTIHPRYRSYHFADGGLLPPAPTSRPPHSLGQVVALSTNIVLMRVETVDKEEEHHHLPQGARHQGQAPAATSSSTTSAAAASIRDEWKHAMDWAEAGKTAVFFHNGGASETCIGNYWYQAYAGGEWWNHQPRRAVPAAQLRRQRRTSSSPPSTEMLAGKEVVVPCMVDGNKDDLHTAPGQDSALQGQPQAAGLQPQARLRRLGRRGLPPAQRHARLHAHLAAAAASIPTPRPSPSSTSTATASPTCAWSAAARSPCCRTAASR